MMTHNDANMPQQNYAYLDMAYNCNSVETLKRSDVTPRKHGYITPPLLYFIL